MSGGAKAISLHQPWASLLVHGIKRIEGRSWPTSYRGRLWIHATAQVPKKQTIEEMEAAYRKSWSFEGVQPTFPQNYPTSCLLGCVEIVDCLKIECIEAWEELPASVKAEVGSPFCFLCDNPQRLQLPQKMSGSFKIWSFSPAYARDLEQALKASTKVGQEPWSWPSVPDHIRYARLPQSKNSDKWCKKYGSPRTDLNRPDARQILHPTAANASGSWRSPSNLQAEHRVDPERPPGQAVQETQAKAGSSGYPSHLSAVPSPAEHSSSAAPQNCQQQPAPPSRSSIQLPRVLPTSVNPLLKAWQPSLGDDRMATTAAEHLRRLHNTG